MAEDENVILEKQILQAEYQAALTEMDLVVREIQNIKGDFSWNLIGEANDILYLDLKKFPERGVDYGKYFTEYLGGARKVVAAYENLHGKKMETISSIANVPSGTQTNWFKAIIAGATTEHGDNFMKEAGSVYLVIGDSGFGGALIRLVESFGITNMKVQRSLDQTLAVIKSLRNPVEAP